LNNKTEPNFFDRRTLSAIFLVFVTWIGWQYYMQHKYPQLFDKKAPTEAQKEAESKPTAIEKTMDAKIAAATTAAHAATEPTSANETNFDFKSSELSFSVSSKGMGIKNVKLLQYTNRKGETVEFSQNKPPLTFETRVRGAFEPLDFKIEKVSDTEWVGHAQSGAVAITKTLVINPSKYAFDVRVTVQGQDAKFGGLTTFLSDEIEPQKGGSFLNRSQFDRQEAFVDTTESHNNHLYFGTDVVDKTWPSGRVVSLGSPYFTQAIVDHSAVMPEVKVDVQPEKRIGVVALQYDSTKGNGAFDLHYTGFAGPKSFDLLKSVDEDFVQVIDFGFFATIARVILRLLKWFHEMVGNWGIAIILLTVMIRLIVLPFNIMSYRSMKSMQALQPQMAALRERYKDDQQRQNQEVMGLLRTHKVNPLGGCLPIVLQLPFFWALYQVLGHSIELYQQPFFGWIHDLSLKDPFYILPVLMGITMFLQQRSTPNTLDPAQAKMLMFMPLLFAFFMLSLPSGLTLYILVSALFAVIQQLYFMKSHNPLVEKVSSPK
jgi:YidC/Oxa1 family membrane protein insertase